VSYHPATLFSFCFAPVFSSAMSARVSDLLEFVWLPRIKGMMSSGVPVKNKTTRTDLPHQPDWQFFRTAICPFCLSLTPLHRHPHQLGTTLVISAVDFWRFCCQELAHKSPAGIFAFLAKAIMPPGGSPSAYALLTEIRFFYSSPKITLQCAYQTFSPNPPFLRWVHWDVPPGLFVTTSFFCFSIFWGFM